MVKPGVYTVNKKQLKDGNGTTEYIHVEVHPLPQKSDTVVRERKGCRAGKRMMGVLLVLLVIVGIAVGVTYAIRWEAGPIDYEVPEGEQDGHREHPGNVPPDDIVRPEPTERRPPIDYIRTPPPLLGRPEDGHDNHGHDHHGDDHHGHDHHGDDHHGHDHHGHDGDHTGESSEDRDGRPQLDENDDDDGYHRKMNHPPFRGFKAWKVERGRKQQKIAQTKANPVRPAYQGRSRVEIEEEKHGFDYGHGARQQKGRQ